MEEEMNDFDENFCEGVEETDEEYEFDASGFFDFTRAEYDWEIEEAERWFEVSGYYDPSPFIVKLNLEKLFSSDVVPNASKAKNGRNLENVERNGVSASKKNNTEGKRNQMIHEKAKERSSDKSFQPRSSTLMKPTASHLAKQNKLHDHMGSNCFCTRSQRTSSNPSEKSFQSSVGFDNPATKRQKLEMGYLRKMAHLKHHILYLHKSTKKVTVPREPELETLLRAQRRSSKNSSASSENEKDGKKGCSFKPLPLNRKTPSLPQIRKSTTQLTQSQSLRLKTMDRADQHASAKASKSKNANQPASYGATDSKRLNSRETLKQAKQESSLNSKAHSSAEKEPELPSSDQLTEVPPIEQFFELSLGSDSDENKMTRSERNNSTKEVEENAENVPDSFRPNFLKCHGKPNNQCGGHLRVHEASWSNMNRGLDIR